MSKEEIYVLNSEAYRFPDLDDTSVIKCLD